jgi:SpoVK/Ycf46/Vps4 family AAA+-type ATPase
MKPVRRLMERLQSVDPQSLPSGKGNAKVAKSRYSVQVNEVGNNIDNMLKADPITLQDMTEALQTTKPSSDQTLQVKYEQWQQDYGSV